VFILDIHVSMDQYIKAVMIRTHRWCHG